MLCVNILAQFIHCSVNILFFFEEQGSLPGSIAFKKKRHRTCSPNHLAFELKPYCTCSSNHPATGLVVKSASMSTCTRRALLRPSMASAWPNHELVDCSWAGDMLQAGQKFWVPALKPEFKTETKFLYINLLPFPLEKPKPGTLEQGADHRIHGTRDGWRGVRGLRPRGAIDYPFRLQQPPRSEDEGPVVGLPDASQRPPG